MTEKKDFRKPVGSHEVIARFGLFEGEQFEIRLKDEDGQWMAVLNFRDPNAQRLTNSYNGQGIPEFYANPDQYSGTLNLLECGNTWFTLREGDEPGDALVGWLSSYPT